MNDCCTPEASGNVRAYTFLDLNGVPYIHGEYLDRSQIRQIDRSMVRSEVTIQQDNQSRVVVDCSINDIGLRGSDGMPDVVGNLSKQRNLMKLIQANYERLDHTLDVIRGGITLTVEYRLEDATTGFVISTFQNAFTIPNREYYLDINPHDVNDNAIISHFADTMVSAVNEFAHGHRRIMMRITGINMSYCMLTRDPKNWVGPNAVLRPSVQPLPTCYGTEFDYYYHDQMQANHMMDVHGCGCHPSDPSRPPSWMNFNRFYHFDDNGKILVLHHDEIHDPSCKTMRVPCGRVTMNRLVEVRPGTRVVFRFSVWKNDITVMNDVSAVAKSLQAPTANWHCSGHQFCGDIAPDNETIIRLLKDAVNANCEQNRVINSLAAQVDHLQHQIEHMNGHGHCCDHDCTCHKPDAPVGPISVGDKTFATAQEAIDAIQNGDAAGELVLMNDVTENLTITGKVTINLNGCTISAPTLIDSTPNSHTIMVDGGELTIYGEGSVTNDNFGGCCVINLGVDDEFKPKDYEIQGIGQGVVHLRGGSHMRKALDRPHQGYAIVNHGASMVISDGVEVDTSFDGASLVCNGFQGDALSQPIMYINGGTFRGGRHTINNDHGGRMIIGGGMFTMGTPWVDANFVTGPKNVLRNEDTSLLVIKGGKFVGTVENNNEDEDAVRILGGTFTVDVKKYCPTGYQQKVTGEVVKE